MSLLWDGKTPSPLGEHFSKLGYIRAEGGERCTKSHHIRRMI